MILGTKFMIDDSKFKYEDILWEKLTNDNILNMYKLVNYHKNKKD